MLQRDDANPFRRSLHTATISFGQAVRPRRQSGGQGLFPTQVGFWAVVAGVCATTLIMMIWLDADLIAWKRQHFSSDSAVVKVFAIITLIGTSGWILVLTGLAGLYLSATRWSLMQRQHRL